MGVSTDISGPGAQKLLRHASSFSKRRLCVLLAEELGGRPKKDNGTKSTPKGSTHNGGRRGKGQEREGTMQRFEPGASGFLLNLQQKGNIVR